MELKNILIKKKHGTVEHYDFKKLKAAVNQSAVRARETELLDLEMWNFQALIEEELMQSTSNIIETSYLHMLCERFLAEVAPDVGKAYSNYHSFRMGQAKLWEKVMGRCRTLISNNSSSVEALEEKNQNANADSTLASTMKCFIADYTAEAEWEEFFLTRKWKQILNDGYIYAHDKNGRHIYPFNCCLFLMAYVLEHGCVMNGIHYNKPTSLDKAFDVMGDLILMCASQQYGGFTIPRIDSILAPYAEMSYNRMLEKYKSLDIPLERAEIQAYEDVKQVMYDGFQGLEIKLNTVASSRGDYPFTTISFGIDKTKWGKLASIAALETRAGGQGEKGKKQPVLFPKLVFLYDENLHGKGKELEDVFEAGLKCSSKTMYPDWLSLTGDGYVPSMYKKYGEVVSPMGCVDGKEIITYKINNNLYVESFERMWDRLSDTFEPQRQIEGQDHLYMNLSGVEIYDTEKGFVKTNTIIRNISDNWIDLHLSNGRRLLCTADHPLTLTSGETKHVEDLQKGDEILINSSQYTEERIHFNTDKAWLLGLLLCDGSYQDYAVSASIAATGEDEIEEKFHKTFKKYFSLDTKTKLQERGIKGTYKDLCAIADEHGNMQKTINYLAEKFGGVVKNARHIPNEVFSWNYESKLAFLAGMIDADGYINATSSNGGGAVVQIGSTNKELALQQMALAQALGMPAKLYHNHYSKNNPAAIRYRVEFFPIEELLQYITCEKKKNNFSEAYSEHYTTTAVVTELIPQGKVAYSYDVSTDSEHFEVSGIYSHNCRAFLSPWYKEGGMHPAHENDVPVFEGRFNIGVFSLHLPMIYMQSVQESRDFYEVLDYYLEVIREMHKKTYEYLSHMKASINPVGFCYGGFYGGHLKPDDDIAPILKYSTASFGVTALNELEQLHHQKSLHEDGSFALEVMQHINDKINEFKEEDNILYAIYGTPAEKLCGTQVKQFRALYGIVKNVSDREYVSNSFHDHVTEDISPIEKQNDEVRFWNHFNGGKIQYCKYPVGYNYDAMRSLIRRAMKLGLYEGVNLSLCFCDDCGYEQLSMGLKCPKCGSVHITEIERMNGYLGFSRQGKNTSVKTDAYGNETIMIRSRFAPHKDREIQDRVSM